MEELLEKIENLKDSLNNEQDIKELKSLTKKIYLNKDLIKQIEEYKIKPKEELKLEIYSNKDYQRYKELETNINIMIMKINKELKNINSKGKCSL